jgi:hypothetical protein
VRDARAERSGRLRTLALDGLELELGSGERVRVPLEHAQALAALDDEPD